MDENLIGQPKTPRRRFGQMLSEWVVALILALVGVLFLTMFVIMNAQIPSSSMENTIQAGDRVIGLRIAYTFGEPARNDVVIFRSPDNNDELYVKRIIGMPGDEVEIRDGQVYVNGQAQPQDYVKEPPQGDYGPYTVPSDSYFMLGDNRNNSLDSRYWENTYVSRESILAKAVLSVFPSVGIIE